MSLSRGEAYAVLELPVGADPDSIRSSYKRLLHKFLPDTRRIADNSEAFTKFQDVSRAYQRLITDNDVSNMTQKEMFEVYQQVFAKPKSQQSNSQPKPHSNGFPQKSVSNCINDNSDSDTDSNDSSNEAASSSWSTTKGTAKENGSILNDEQEQKRLEKRKAKKKQRKERKKLDKQVSKSSAKDGTQHPQQQQSGMTDCLLTENSCNIDRRTNASNVTSGSNDDADEFAGAFYSHVRNRHAVAADPLLQENRLFENKQSVRMEPSDEACDPIVLQSRQLAMIGNEQANCGDYVRAIEFFTQAIKLDPNECRFYGNRSYCYDRQQVYDKALHDAEKAISLSAAWPKGYFRKGRALAGLKRYMEAEEAFKQVLTMDPKCDDAVLELHRLHVLHMTEMGFSEKQAELALASHASFQQALDSLLSGFNDCTINHNGSAMRNMVLNATAGSRSAPANGSSSGRRQKSPQRLHPLLAAQYIEHQGGSPSLAQPSLVTQSNVDVKMDPTNPEGLTALWVGNVLPQVSEKKLVQMFSRYGTITSIRSLPDKFCAFINFKEKESASQALVGLQGTDCAGQKLLIKFPDHPLTSNSPNKTFAKTSSLSTTTATRNTDLPQRFRKK